MANTTGLPVLFATGNHAGRPAASAVGSGGLYSCTTHSLVYQTDGSSWATWATLGATGALTDPMTTRGDLIVRNASNVTDRKAIGSADTFLGSDGTDPAWGAVTEAKLSTSDITTNNATTSKHGFLKKLSNSATDYMDGTGNWSTPAGGGGGSISTVDQDLGSDQTTNNSSTWTDVTGLTGISLTAGTWMTFCDVEVVTSVSYGPVFRVWDGTTTFAQMGSLVSNPVAAVSNHWHFASKPFVLGGSATLAVQYNTDTVCTIKKFPTRGSISTSVATHITCMKIA